MVIKTSGSFEWCSDAMDSLTRFFGSISDGGGANALTPGS